MGRSRLNENGLSFERWLAAATIGEEAKLEPLREEMCARRAEFTASRLLGQDPATIRVRGIKARKAWWTDDPAQIVLHEVDLVERAKIPHYLARKAWRAGYDPADFAAAPRPLPRDFCKELRQQRRKR